jgi:hypothetical protein
LGEKGHLEISLRRFSEHPCSSSLKSLGVSFHHPRMSSPLHPVTSGPSFENCLRGLNCAPWAINAKSFHHLALTGAPKIPALAPCEPMLSQRQNSLARNFWKRIVAPVHRLNASLDHSRPYSVSSWRFALSKLLKLSCPARRPSRR